MTLAGGDNHSLSAHYDAMWRKAFPAISAGKVSCDPKLSNKSADTRRGLTLVARLSADTNRRLAEAIDQLSEIEPAQYCHPQVDLHLTVLSLYTVSDDFGPCLERLEHYRDAVGEALESARPFVVDTAGITLSNAAVLAQGFPQDGALDDIRERLRTTLARDGLGDSLDQRYRLVTAHTTLMRFSRPLENAALFSERLLELRGRNFGTSAVSSLDLVFNDWYMSSGKLSMINSYQLCKNLSVS
jgi:2'-5' RNA ligase